MVEDKIVPLKFCSWKIIVIEENSKLILISTSVRTLNLTQRGYYFLFHPFSRKDQNTRTLASLQNLIALLSLELVPIVVCVVGIWPAGSCNARKTGLFSVSVSDHCDTKDNESGHYPWEISVLGARLFTTAMSNPVLLVNFDQRTPKVTSSFNLQVVLEVRGYYFNLQPVFQTTLILFYWLHTYFCLGFEEHSSDLSKICLFFIEDIPLCL